MPSRQATTTAPASPDGFDILILGGGIAGLITALALTKFAPEGKVPRVRIFEIRPEPATIGGAVHLTPNALRLLDYLGVLPIVWKSDYGKEIDYLEVFDIYSGYPPYKALRITRGDAPKGVLVAVSRHENISLTCGKSSIGIEETPEKVITSFEDGDSASGELLMGCDGIHSVTRMEHVEPKRKATYSGVSNAFGFAPIKKDFQTHFECTVINFARRGMLLTSFHSSTSHSVYVGGLMQVQDIGSRDSWKAVGSDAEKTRGELLSRFGDAKIPCIKPLIEKAGDFYLWPVFTLSKHGRWATDRVILLGDAAHAVPPQGESTGIVFEDTALFSRCLTRWIEKGRPISMKETFDAYERLRRVRIENAFEESKDVVRTVPDSGWLGHTIKKYVVPWYLWWTRSKRDVHFVEDVSTVDIGY